MARRRRQDWKAARNLGRLIAGFALMEALRNYSNIHATKSSIVITQVLTSPLDCNGLGLCKIFRQDASNVVKTAPSVNGAAGG
jgi:hypothetical protein